MVEELDKAFQKGLDVIYSQCTMCERRISIRLRSKSVFTSHPFNPSQTVESLKTKITETITAMDSPSLFPVFSWLTAHCANSVMRVFCIAAESCAEWRNVHFRHQQTSTARLRHARAVSGVVVVTVLYRETVCSAEAWAEYTPLSYQSRIVCSSLQAVYHA